MRSFVGCLAAVLLLAGCTADTPSETRPTPTGDARAPTSVNEDEAIAAARDAYAGYLEAANEIAREGGSAPDRIRPFVTESLAEGEIAAYAAYVQAGTRIDGASTFDSFELRNLEQGQRSTRLTAYVCLDLTDTRLLDSAGQDITPSSRPARLPLEVEFVSSPDDPDALLLNKNSPWSGENFC